VPEEMVCTVKKNVGILLKKADFIGKSIEQFRYK
jgi:hypothetical protein